MTTLDQLVEPWERSLGCHLSEGPMTKFRLDTLSFYVKDPKNGWTTWLTFSHHCMTNQIECNHTKYLQTNGSGSENGLCFIFISIELKMNI